MCLVLVVKKSQWHDDDYCSFVSIKDLCPCKNQLITPVCLVAAGWEVKMRFVHCGLLA